MLFRFSMSKVFRLRSSLLPTLLSRLLSDHSSQSGIRPPFIEYQSFAKHEETEYGGDAHSLMYSCRDDSHIHTFGEMIITVRLINISITSHSCLFLFEVRTLKVYPLSKLHAHSTVLTTVTVLYIRSPELILPVTEGIFIPFDRDLSVFPMPQPLVTTTLLWETPIL